MPLASPTPVSDPARIDQLRTRVADLAHATPGRLGLAIVDLFDETHVSVRGAENVPLANVGKLAIAFAAYRQVDQKRLQLEERVVVRRSDLRGAPSAIAALHPRGDASYTYWELVRAMLVSGDNTATALVLQRVGGPAAVQGVLDRLGLRGITLSNDPEARGSTGTPDTVAALLAGIVEHRLLFLDSASEFFDALSHAETEPQRLRAGLSPSIKLASISGSSAAAGSSMAATNDAGIATFAYGRRVVVVVFLTASNATADERDAAIANVGRAVDAAFH